MTEELLVVRRFAESRQAYLNERQAILSSSGGSLHGERRSGNGWSGGRVTEAKAARLENLERLPWVREMRAVERARERIGAGLPEEMRDELRKSIMLNCASGRKYPFERLYTVGISRSGFYRYRRAFLSDLSEELRRARQNERF